MDKTAPTVGKLMLAIGFALSSFALLLFLWVSFGGPVPLGPKGYRVTVPFDEAAQLATEADVRISGVTVGHVTGVELERSREAAATLELDAGLSPLPADTRAVLRTKTLLGETYVELAPGTPAGPTIPEGGRLPAARVEPAVQLDEVLRTFDERTRADLRDWLQGSARALGSRGADLNAALGTLDPFTRSARDVLEVLDAERESVRGLVRDGGAALQAISERPGALRGLIESGDTVFGAIAARDAELRRTFELLPGLLDESRRTLAAYEEFSALADPLVLRLTPAARELSPALTAFDRLAPELTGFARGLGPVTDRAPGGLAALRNLLSDPLPQLLGGLDPWLDDVTPQLEAVRAYRREVTAFVANLAAASNAFNRPPEAGFEITHYLRTVNPLGPEALAAFGERPDSSRSNPYVRPGGYRDLASGLPSFATGTCGTGPTAALDPATAGLLPGDLFARIKRFAFAGKSSTAELPAPPCRTQAKQRSLGGPPTEKTYFQHVNRLP